MAQATILVLLITALPSKAEACSCVGDPPPPCQATWTYPLVFAGKVTSIIPLDLDLPKDQPRMIPGPRRVRFAVQEAFRGSDTPEIELSFRGGGSSACEIEFQVGEEYLVYANHRLDAPGWTASRCGRTRRLINAAEDLAYLRLSQEEKGASRIFGRVRHFRDEFLPTTVRTVETPLANVRVRVRDAHVTIETLTAEDGSYSIEVDSHRHYEVSMESLPGMVPGGSKTVWIPHHHSCAPVDFAAIEDGRVSGVVVDSGGLPVPFLPLSLKQSRDPSFGIVRHEVETDEAGRFEFQGVRPAVYSLGMNEHLWPDAHMVDLITIHRPIALEPSERLDLGRAALPPSARAVLVEGIVLHEDGKPIPDLLVSIDRPDERFAGWGATTDARGVFRISLLAGHRYRFDAEVFRRDARGGVTFRAVETLEVNVPAKVRLRLAPYR